MARPLAKSPFVLLALGLWILACATSLAENDDPKALDQQVTQLIEQGKYQEAIPLAEKAVETARHVRGPKNPVTATCLNNLAELYRAMGEYAKAEPLLEEALRIRQKALGPEHPDVAASLNNLAEVYHAMGEYAKAEPLLEEALRIQRKVLGSEHLDTALSLNNLGSLYDLTGEYAKAEPLLQEAVRIRQKILGPEHPGTADSLHNLADLYQQMHEYAKAEPLLQEALRICQKVLGPEHPDTATSLRSLASLYRDMDEYGKAEPLYQEALRIRQKVFGPEHPDTATSLNNLGSLYQSMGEYAKAEPLYQEALRVRQKVLGPEHPDTTASLNNLADLYQDTGEYAKAEPLLQEALRIRQKVLGSEHPDTATSFNNLGSLYWAKGEYARAEPLLQEALRIRQKVLGPEHPDTAASLDNLGSLYWAKAEYPKAEPLLQEALRIRKKVLGSESPRTADSLTNLAGFYEAMGERARAEPLFQEALRIRQKVLGPEDLDTADSLINLAWLYQEMHEYYKAERLNQEALRIRQKVLGPEHPDTAASLNSLAMSYWATRDYAKVEPLLQEALRIRQKVLGSESPRTADSLTNLASMYQAMGEYAKAEPLCREALRICQKVLGQEHPDTEIRLQKLARLEFDLDRINEATALARQGAAAQLTILSKILSFTSEQQRLAYLQIFFPYNLFPVLRGTETELAAAVLRYKGVVLDSIVEDRLIAEASWGSEGQQLVEQLNSDKSQLGGLLLQPRLKPSDESHQRIETLEGEVEKIESQFAQHFAGLGQARHALGVSLVQVQSTIPDDGALIEYLQYWRYLGKSPGESPWRESYGAIVMLSKGPPLWIPLGKANEIEHLVRRYATLVRGSPEEDELSANLQALYEALWAPIGQALQTQTKRIIISPDGQLNFISFATLLTKDKQFLAQTYDVQYVSSGRDLLREPKPTNTKEVVLFANPDFDLGLTAMSAKAEHRSSDPHSKPIRGAEQRDVEDWSFERLEGTQKERDELIKTFAGWRWTVTDFTANQATKEALLKIRSPYILHLATHGFFAKEDPATSKGEPESPLSDRQSVIKSKFFKNPMHRSGLALAGAETTIEAWKRDEVPAVENDGILTAEDVSTLDLKGTWLVTLSACDTGSGEARAGEGVMGLRRGFIQAGAQNLLMTLWPISDEVTVRIMSDFYEAAHKTGNVPEALAEVQRNWLLKLRTEKGLTQAVNLAGPFIMSSQGKP
jgi:tetratricopeptide (TPR) repeat protein